MSIVQDFDYRVADSIGEATRLLAAADGASRVLAGGTDLVPWMRDGMVAPDFVVDIKGIPGLDEITFAADRMELGALVTFTDVLESEAIEAAVPVLGEMALTVASPAIRNRATVAGNLCSAVPSADAAPILLTLDAEVRIAGVAGTRTVALPDFLVGPHHTALGDAEIVTAVTIRIPPADHGAAFAKLTRYGGEDLAQASVAVLALPGDEYRVAFGAVAPTPIRAPGIEATLNGQALGTQVLAEARRQVAEVISPITDIRATAEYRTRMCEVMLERACRAAVARRGGAGPPYGTHFV